MQPINWETWMLIPALVVLIILSAFFSGSETAYTSINLGKLESKISSTSSSKSAKLIKSQLSKFERLLMTLLICNNLVNILVSLITGILIGKILESSGIGSQRITTISTVVSLAVLTPVLVIFGEITPKIWAKRISYQYLKFAAYPIQLFIWLLFPFTSVTKFFKPSTTITNREIDLKGFVEIANQEGILDHAETNLVKNAFDLDSEKVLSHYVKLENVTTLPIDSTIGSAIKVFKETNYSRIPLTNSQGAIMGLVHVSDILAEDDNAQLSKYVRELPKIPLSTSLKEALETLRLKKSHMTAVTRSRVNDEVVGIMTMEDIIEELIGEIYDEHDDEQEVLEVSLGKYYIWGTSLISELESAAEIIILDENESNKTVTQWFMEKTNKSEVTIGDIYIYDEKYFFEALENDVENDVYFEISIK